MHIGFTGTRSGMTDKQQAMARGYLSKYPSGNVTVHHGDCLGADAQVDAIAVSLLIEIAVHPPESSAMRAWCRGGLRTVCNPEPYAVRNQHIVCAVNILVALPKETALQGEQKRGGTWQTVRMARRACKSVHIFWADGDQSVELR
jgi:hypothetical protein